VLDFGLKVFVAMRAPDEESDSPSWRIWTIAADEAGARFYLDKLKPFRLAALKQDPDGE